MNLDGRLTELEARHVSSQGDGEWRDALLKSMEAVGERFSHDNDFSRASPMEISSYILCKDEVRTDVPEMAKERAKQTGPIGKLFRGILTARGVTL